MKWWILISILVIADLDIKQGRLIKLSKKNKIKGKICVITLGWDVHDAMSTFVKDVGRIMIIR